jgi:arginyl-tRNA synthetase
MTDLREIVAAAVQDAVAAVTGEHIPLPHAGDPPRPEFGDLAFAVALELGHKLGRPPRQLAEELIAYLREQDTEAVQRWEIAGPGFMNAFFDRGYVLSRLLGSLHQSDSVAAVGPKVVVEHTSINPNKAAHIGHLRNSILGDSLVRLLRHQGVPVEVHNYIDDTGVQVADVVLGLVDLRGLNAEAVRSMPDPFDYACWDLYTEVTARLESDERLAARRHEVLIALERGTGTEAEVGGVVVERIIRRHLETMARLGIEYDLLVHEGDIVSMDLWSTAFERLKASEHVYFAEDGKHAGCWMMRLSGVAGFEDLEEPDKVLVRSNGAATYVAKDIAYHMWRYGELENPFLYRKFGVSEEGHVTWQSGAEGEQMPFGDADHGVSVIDVRQAYLQSIVAIAVASMDPDGRTDRHTHFDYEMVALTPKTAKALGIPLTSEDQGRPFVEMSGRRGVGVKADDLLNVLTERAKEEVLARNPDLSEDEIEVLAVQIAIAAARYFLVKFARKTVIAFDLDDALNFEGETGPYLQYAAVRTGSIFGRMQDDWGVSIDEAVSTVLSGQGAGSGAFSDAEPAAAADGDIEPLSLDQLRDVLEEEENEMLWVLALQLARFDRVVDLAVQSSEVSVIAKYAFTLAQDFNRLYHKYPILQEEDLTQRGVRLLLAYALRQRLRQAMSLLGIPVPDRM